MDRYGSSGTQRDFVRQSESVTPQAVNTVFREPVHQVLEKIKNKPYFKWPNKMSGDPLRRNQSLHCQYHQERGHTTKNCRALWNHLKQLVKEGRLQQFLSRSNEQGNQSGTGAQGNAPPRPPLGTVNVIFAMLRRTGSCPAKVMSVVGAQAEDSHFESKRAKSESRPLLSFLDKDKVGTIQPHDDALVVTLRIGGYDVKCVMVNQGSNAKIMYPNLYKGLNLKSDDLAAYDSPLISFDGKLITPRGQIRLPV